MMPYNLLTERWLPVLRADQTKDQIAPWEITDRYADNPVIALNAPRPDFNGALVQFLIGLLQTAYAPENRIRWDKSFKQPPTALTLRSAFERYIHAFNLDGDGPRFMQDRDTLDEQKPLPITALLIDTAGSETHFIKDLPTQGVSPAFTAMALYALQTNAPSGGVGHRTSLRGGGPLTTLVVAASTRPDTIVTLWQTLWLNVLKSTAFDSRNERDQDIFPWLAPTRISDKNSRTPVTTPEDVNPLQCFWGMPRRIRLDFDEIGVGECGLSGTTSEILVRQYRTKNYGINYGGAWEHTLSPHRYEPSGERIPLHPRGSINYRHWLGLVQSTEEKKTKSAPAKTVLRFSNNNLADRNELCFRLWAFGYDMDNMKPRCWYESTMPLFQVKDEIQRKTFEHVVDCLIRAARLFHGNLRSCLKEAWFDNGDPRQKNADMGFLDTAFWPDTENKFYELVTRLHSDPAQESVRTQVYLDWHSSLNTYTLAAFDRHTNINRITEQNPKRIADARRLLKRFNYKKDIKILLDMPLTSPKS
jgi:CRISPR system Cascade subunit CasA